MRLIDIHYRIENRFKKKPKYLPYSTRNYRHILYIAIAIMEKDLKIYIYRYINIYMHTHLHLYINLNHFAIHLKLTQHCKSTICCCCFITKLCLTLWTPRTAAHQSPLSLGFPRQEHWSELPFLLQEIFPTHASNPSLLYFN